MERDERASIGPNNGSRHDPERIDDTSIEYEIRDLLKMSLRRKTGGCVGV